MNKDSISCPTTENNQNGSGVSKGIKMVWSLLITTLITSLVLSCIYRATKPKIADLQNRRLELSLKQVIDADQFIVMIPETLYQAVKYTDTIGIVFRIFPRGWSDKIPITVGLNNEGMVTGIKIATPSEGLKETPGLGTKIIEPEFTGQYRGKTLSQIRLKKEGGVIDGITGATISSRAVIDGIRNGVKHYQRYLSKKDPRVELFPEAKKFVPIIEDSSWFVYNGTGQSLGLVLITTNDGFCGKIKIMVGIDQNRQIVGVKIIEQHETEGIGSSICEEDFLRQFSIKANFETVSGATISSMAVIGAVEEAMRRYKHYLITR